MTTTTRTHTTRDFIAALDVGTTTIRCQIINSFAETVGLARTDTKLLYPQPGYVEICPNELWDNILNVIKEAINDAKLTAKDIKCIGISTQRATFITWRKDNGVPYHNFITWKDIRAKKLVKTLNSSWAIKTIRCFSYITYLLLRNKRFLAGSKLKVTTNHVTGRLLWALNNIPSLKEGLLNNNVMFGTVDTWLIYKFSNHKLHLTDITNASATAFYDPFVLKWGTWATKFLGIPEQILPTVVENDYNFGLIDKKLLGASIPITAIIADQSASMFASCSFQLKDLKITIGTGAFLDVNTCDKIYTSVNGMYPLIGWNIQGEYCYIGETACYDCGSLIEWLIKADLIKKPTDSEKMANSVKDSDGVYFIPAFSGLGVTPEPIKFLVFQPPIDNVKAASGFIGIKPNNNKNHMIRAILESIAYRITLSYSMLQEDSENNFNKIVIDGGVSRNDFICQLIANLTGLNVERLTTFDMSVLGAAFVAGLSSGVWKNKEELIKFRKIEKTFQPSTDKKCSEKCKKQLNEWLKAVERFKSWYQDS